MLLDVPDVTGDSVRLLYQATEIAITFQVLRDIPELTGNRLCLFLYPIEIVRTWRLHSRIHVSLA
jgi:hypothetical protein